MATRVRPYIRAAPGGEFINVSGHVRRSRSAKRYSAQVNFTYEGYGQVSIFDRETQGFRTLFVGDPQMSRDIADAINAGRVAPRPGFLR